MFDHVCVINLKRRVDRRYFMEYKLKSSFDHPVVFVDAIDGYSDHALPLFKPFKNSKYYYGRITSPGAIGLLLTWKKLLQECVSKNLKRILILEDDIYFHRRFKHLLHDSRKHIESHDVVFLGGNQMRWDSDQLQNIDDGESLYKVSEDKWHCTYGTYAICLNRNAMRVILHKLNEPWTDKLMTIDVMINVLIRDKLINGGVLYPNLVIPEMRNSDNMPSRDMVETSKTRKWQLCDYVHIDMYDTAESLLKRNFSVRTHNDFCIGSCDRMLTKYLVEKDEHAICVVIPSYNNEKIVEKNLTSVFRQSFKNWRIIYVDDASTDDTLNTVRTIVQKHEMHDKVTVFENVSRRYQAYSRRVAYMNADKDEICVLLDGDDWLAHDGVFKLLNHKYNKHNLLCSYGQFAYFEDGKISGVSGKYNFPIEIVQKNAYRQYKWISQHMRTAKAHLLQSIPEENLKTSDGKYLTRCTDMAEMFWLLEHSDGRHRNIGSLVYIYNKDNSKLYPNSYYNESKESRAKLENYIRNQGSAKLPSKQPIIKTNYELELNTDHSLFLPAGSKAGTHRIRFDLVGKYGDDYSFSLDNKNVPFVIDEVKPKFIVLINKRFRKNQASYNVKIRCQNKMHAKISFIHAFQINTYVTSITVLETRKKILRNRILPDNGYIYRLE